MEVVQTMARRRRDGLGEGDGGMGHGLLVVGAIGRQRLARRVQRLAEAGDVAVAEDGPDAGEVGHLDAVDVDELARQVAHERPGRR